VDQKYWMNYFKVSLDVRIDYGILFILTKRVFSGRRGIHCWISDLDIKSLPNNARGSMSDFLQLYGDKKGQKISKSAINHPSFSFDSKVYAIAEKYFLKIYCKEMIQMFDNPNDSLKFLNLINHQSTKDEISKVLPTLQGTIPEKWNSIKDIFFEKKSSYLILEIVYSFVYPRLDINVSKSLNHLLKSPFCVHPSTGNICVPFDVKTGFDISKTPNLEKLIKDPKVLDSSLSFFDQYVKKLNKN
jgi:DNA primase small subunit